MPPKIDPFWEGYIVALSDIGCSYSRIRTQCKKKGFTVSDKGIHAAINRNANPAQTIAMRRQKGQKEQPAPQRSQGVIAKVRQYVTQENPPPQREIARRVRRSTATVNRIIRDNLGLRSAHKRRVHVLKPTHIAQRRVACKRLYEGYLAGDKWRYVITLDEAWVYLTGSKQVRAIYYRRSDGNDHAKWVRSCKESFPKGFMVVTGFCAKGKLPIHRVSSNVKVNAAYYIEHVLDPIYRQHAQALYGNDTDRVFIHQDKASSHTAKRTVAYMTRMEQETGVKAIPFRDIPVKSPDASPMDFCAFGLLKRNINKRRPTTLGGLWKVCKEEWAKLDQAVLNRSLLQWKLRCRAIVHQRGSHIEHDRWWKRGFTP